MIFALIADYSLPRPISSKPGELLPFLEAYIARKQQQIDEITQVVERYEKKQAAEERAYQTMSPLRRMLSGKKPDHHLAVEYIHYVKKPMEQVRKLRAEIEAVQEALAQNPLKKEDLPEEIRNQIISNM
ncbi:hypothetical protein [Gorillibacterium massiliense]|uniref:hypothetical protein n=1 Tax=Gorillibacterium massiliense TaxID=1280390 RepID=UPI0004B874B6|nr:hypothetical protein [Gorillibacterium massiliense]